ncbi:hypothetical protein C5C10_06935 [Rathayibacter sp. AY1A3]|nr:hypothetical protein C5C10_06935 [Rathayibacter sp. AY1A3]
MVLVEQFERGHDRGSSHGATRIFRRSYLEDDYRALTGRAERAWARLEAETGRRLLHPVGAIDHGDPAVLAAVEAVLLRDGIPVVRIEADEAQRRWPGLRFETVVLLRPGSRGTASRSDRSWASCSRTSSPAERRGSGSSCCPREGRVRPEERLPTGEQRVLPGGGFRSSSGCSAACRACSALLAAVRVEEDGVVPAARRLRCTGLRGRAPSHRDDDQRPQHHQGGGLQRRRDHRERLPHVELRRDRDRVALVLVRQQEDHDREREHCGPEDDGDRDRGGPEQADPRHHRGALSSGTTTARPSAIRPTVRNGPIALSLSTRRYCSGPKALCDGE